MAAINLGRLPPLLKPGICDAHCLAMTGYYSTREEKNCFSKYRLTRRIGMGDEMMVWWVEALHFSHTLGGYWPSCKASRIFWVISKFRWVYFTIKIFKKLFRATRWAHNPNFQVVFTHASHVCSQHSFGLPLRMYGMYRTHFDHARLDLLPLVIRSRVFWPSLTWNLLKAQRWSKSVLTFDRCLPHSVT